MSQSISGRCVYTPVDVNVISHKTSDILTENWIDYSTLSGIVKNHDLSRWNYYLGGVGIYMGTIIMEGAAMSLESKVRFTPCPFNPYSRLCACGI